MNILFTREVKIYVYTINTCIRNGLESSHNGIFFTHGLQPMHVFIANDDVIIVKFKLINVTNIQFLESFLHSFPSIFVISMMFNNLCFQV